MPANLHRIHRVAGGKGVAVLGLWVLLESEVLAWRGEAVLGGKARKGWVVAASTAAAVTSASAVVAPPPWWRR